MFPRHYPKLAVVTTDDVRDHLPELLKMVADGVRVVITDGGKWSAMLGPAPPTPPTPDEEAELMEKRKEIVRGWMKDAEQAGHTTFTPEQWHSVAPAEEKVPT